MTHKLEPIAWYQRNFTVRQLGGKVNGDIMTQHDYAKAVIERGIHNSVEAVLWDKL